MIAILLLSALLVFWASIRFERQLTVALFHLRMVFRLWGLRRRLRRLFARVSRG